METPGQGAARAASALRHAGGAARRGGEGEGEGEGEGQAHPEADAAAAEGHSCRRTAPSVPSPHHKYPDRNPDLAEISLRF
jgi:hypothetical protein